MHFYRCLFIFILISQAGNSFVGISQQMGCTDPVASNFDIQATQNDGSCLYPPTIIDPSEVLNLPATLNETSGLIIWNDSIWTHNDDTDQNLYSFDKNSPNTYQTHFIQDVENLDWEDITQDATHIYIGDFGNNLNGNRTNLRILRISKAGLNNGSSTIDTIAYSYENQTDFSPSGTNNTNFDCEAFIAGTDSLYLFSKEWVSEKTSLFSIPKIPGTHIAKLKSTYNVDGLVTGSDYSISDSLIVLSGYSPILSPFIVLLYDFIDQDFLSGNKRKVMLNTPFHQVEGIATEVVNQKLNAYLTNERFENSIITTPSKIIEYDLHSVLTNELSVYNQSFKEKQSNVLIFPNPTTDYINVQFNQELPTEIHISTQEGRVLQSINEVKSDSIKIDISHYESGVYFVKFVINEHENIVRFIKE
jgi:hypothetical protein